jgi:hypothetical protein
MLKWMTHMIETAAGVTILPHRTRLYHSVENFAEASRNSRATVRRQAPHT